MRRSIRQAGVVLWIIGAATGAGAQPTDDDAQAPSATAPLRWPLQGRAQGGERLSQLWLDALARSRGANSAEKAYGPGMVWLRQADQAAQQARRQALLAQIAQLAQQGVVREDAARQLSAALAAMPITGRVPLPAHDPRWMQAHPQTDPVLAAGDAWLLPARPHIVQVWREDGQPCELAFKAGAPAAWYVSACARAFGGGQADVAWVVQPDAQVTEVGLAAWNAQHQAAPAPGARLWAPAHDSGWPQATSRAVAQWLATQPPADSAGDAGAGSIAAPPAPLMRAPRDVPLLAGDWGLTGLLQTPTARTRAAGDWVVTLSHTAPYTWFNAALSPFDRLEVGVRYTRLSNALYGPAIAGDRRYLDKSAELKWRLWDEDRWRPALALGLRDPAGTGLFAGEYLVASKRWGDWDASLGLGWGYLGARGPWRNPLAVLGERFRARRNAEVGVGGTADLGTLFTGRVAPFGGLQWHTPWREPWLPAVIKAELEGNDYRREPFGADLGARSALNIGAVWRFGGANLGAAFERGRKLSLSLAWQGSLPQTATPKLGVPPAVLLERLAPQSAADSDTPPVANTVSRIDVLLRELSEHTGWRAADLQTDAAQWTVQFDAVGGAYVHERLERVWAVLHREAPDGVQRFRAVLFGRQVPLVQHDLERWPWVRARTQWAPRGDTTHDAAVASEPSSPQPGTAATRPWDARVNFGFQQHLGGPDGYLYAFSLRAFGHVRLGPGAWVQGTVQARVLDDYERFTYTGPSELPRVRTFLREYVTSERVTVPNLQATMVQRLRDGLYAQVYGGLLEPMFAGAGGELLWRPLDSSWAVGVDINRVRQRAFEQRLRLRDYAVNTGHVSAYWDTGWHDVIAQVAVGQYLAGDRGVTLELAREFANGTRIGAWATKTNVSSARFGEGSFDKGLYVSVPFDALLTGWSGSSMVVAWQPLVRDGGARLARASNLWGLTELRDRRAQRVRAALPVVP